MSSIIEQSFAPREYITLDSYAMGRTLKFQEEWAKAFPNAVELLGKVNALLTEIGWRFDIEVTSGFRPKELNRSVSKAAKGSYHQVGRAVDFRDSEGIFRHYFNPLMDMNASSILRKYGLFMEHPDYTTGPSGSWIHLDTGFRVDRPSRTFRP